jgi:hypothetical protein
MTADALYLVDGLGRDLADGETFTSHDACISTRYDDELAVWTPGNVEARA